MAIEVPITVLPISTAKMLMAETGLPFPVATALAWADRVLELGIDTEVIVSIYALDDSQGHDCAKLLPMLLADVGAWRDSRIERMAIARDILVNSVLTKAMAPEDFGLAIGQFATELRSAKDDGLLPNAEAAAIDLEAMYLIDDLIDSISYARSCGMLDSAHYQSHGVDPDNLLPWITSALQSHGMADVDAKLIPAKWAAG